VELKRFFEELDRRIAKYDLLCHPFYKAWAAGELTREELREYAGQYYNQVASFPLALSTLHGRLPAGELRDAVLENYRDEVGIDAPDPRPHDEIWLDFAEGMDGTRAPRPPMLEMCDLMALFRHIAREGRPEEALAAFYAYESQVPRVAQTKAAGLRQFYGADDKACKYFDIHQTADVHHAGVWRDQLGKVITNGGDAKKALATAEIVAQALWRALSGIERERQTRRSAA
jgi:pyrroloquinoline-quinone synthase